MPQREIVVTPSRFGWLVLALIFAGTAVVQIYLFFSTAASWPAWAAMVLGALALSCFVNSGLHAGSRLEIKNVKSGEPAG
ncbi:hypothetical protein AB0M83_06895 [Amycolatopsis sp. NPDC051106]|uniref:hypothetical protein n=1 Tax=unclassified Amycolatopsis TaxID=2618356 RepID=UPI00342868DF